MWDVINQFLTGKPSIYDMGFFFTSFILLIAVLGMHFRQMSHVREMKVMNDRLKLLEDRSSEPVVVHIETSLSEAA